MTARTITVTARTITVGVYLALAAASTLLTTGCPTQGSEPHVYNSETRVISCEEGSGQDVDGLESRVVPIDESLINSVNEGDQDGEEQTMAEHRQLNVAILLFESLKESALGHKQTVLGAIS